MKFMKVCGLHDFGWKDLHAPTSKRFRRQLSGAINFARFREERLPIYDELNQQRQDILGALQEAQTENAGLLKDMDDARAATDEKDAALASVVNETARAAAAAEASREYVDEVARSSLSGFSAKPASPPFLPSYLLSSLPPCLPVTLPCCLPPSLPQSLP